MADPQQVEWLLESSILIDMWNFKRQDLKFRADFAGADLYKAFWDGGKLNPEGKIPLSRADLYHADFTEAVLSHADLSEADLQSASLTKADLWGANLTNAKLSRAKLDQADLRHANFTNADLTYANLAGSYLDDSTLAGANFQGANLDNVNLRDANLTDTNLVDANLIGAIFAGTEPWKSVLFTLPKLTLPERTVQSSTITAVEDLLKEIRKLKAVDSDFVLYFRGESESAWELRPSVMRDGFHSSERDMLVDLLSRRPEEFNGRTSALAQWVLAQHHGLRTRFLDITKNPLVALFHSCESTEKETLGHKDGRVHVFVIPKEMVKPFTSDTVSVIANFAKLSRFEQEMLLGKSHSEIDQAGVEIIQYLEARRRLYQMIQQEKPFFDERIDQRDLYKVFVVEPQQSSERIRAQSGAFLLSAFHERFERPEIESHNPGIPVYGHYLLTVPGKKKSDIMKELELLQITHETLYPGLDSSARAVTEFHRPSVA